MKTQDHTDICYIYEENPVAGRTGDAVFVRQLAKDFSDYKFRVARVVEQEYPNDSYGQNTVPNIEGYQTVDLSFHGSSGKGRTSVTYRKAGSFFHSVAKCIEVGQLDQDCINALFDCAADLAPTTKFDAIWKNTTSWELVKAVYQASDRKMPFVQHRELLYEVSHPVWRLISKWRDLPQARIYQADSGIRSAILGLVAARKYGSKLIMVDDCLPLNSLERERQGTKLRLGGIWRPENEAVREARNRWTKLMRTHCLGSADEILANTVSSAVKIRETIGDDRPIRVVREGIEGETARRWGAYYSKESEETSYRIVFLVGSYTSSMGRGILTAIGQIEQTIGQGKFVILSLGSISQANRESFDRGIRKYVSSAVQLKSEGAMIEEIAKATVVAFPNQIEVGDRPIINSLHAGKPVVVSMVDGNSVFADPRLSIETDCFVNPNRLEGKDFPDAIISLVRRKDNLDYHPRRLGEALFNHQEIREGYAKVYQSLSPTT